MADLELDERRLRIELMTVEIEKGRLDIERIRQEIDKHRLEIDKDRLDMDRIHQEMKWEPWKALAAIIAAGVAFAGIILAVAHVIR